MKAFQFKKFKIQQSSAVFRVGTDGVLLGALSTVVGAEKVLEVGTGTGLISLMVAQRNEKAEILALDIDANAKNLAQENFETSIFSERLTCQLQDFKDFFTDQRFDLILSNPPYFEENDSKKDVLARQLITLDFLSLMEKAASLLSEKGKISIIIPFDRGAEVMGYADRMDLYLIKQINIRGIEGSDFKRVILEFSKTESPTEMVEFTIEKSPRIYSDQYLEQTKDFHVFGKK
ncbi:tRNA1(Val) (adenine(37)-N6)-methyltransferase [Amniculibacterium aquaticum]|jgi:tRNA1Val (adenine37-N6)-methyltransferase|uniref:tRNA1(Val) (adenine(37)-N6)-methyltransferase n=1 Tax=Amniculibacterium aquaticum TaxID=2479858 RepID=UPI000F590C15|nr:methyltransferase [Amniculibacterium aquaticum]